MRQFVTSARRNSAIIRCYFVITFFPFMMFIPFCKVLTCLPSSVNICSALLLVSALALSRSEGQVIDLFFHKNLRKNIIYMYLCSVFVESLNLVLCQESQENQAEQASIM